MKNYVEKAFTIAKKAHKGQFRRDGKTPYIEHPLEVYQRFIPFFPREEMWLLQAIALLHDVLEDSKITVKDLKDAGIPDLIVKAVVILTHLKDQSYIDYILEVKGNEWARRVKIEDIRHNMSTSSGNQKDKYLLALHILEH